MPVTGPSPAAAACSLWAQPGQLWREKPGQLSPPSRIPEPSSQHASVIQTGWSLGFCPQGSVLLWGLEFDRGSDVSCISQSKAISLLSNFLYMMSLFSLHSNLRNRDYYPPFTNEKIRAQRS